jgi:hypothetical protein
VPESASMEVYSIALIATIIDTFVVFIPQMKEGLNSAFSHICTRICCKMRNTFTPHLFRDIFPLLLENVPVSVFFYPSHHKGIMKRSVSKSDIFLAPLLGPTGKEWRTRRHTPDKTRHDANLQPS